MRSSLNSFGKVALSACFAFALLAQSARADLITLTLNPTQSFMTLSGGAFGLAFAGQNAGALRASLSGTITADLSSGVLTFTGGSTITVDANPNGPFTIAPNTATIPGVQNYGVTATGLVLGAGNSTINGVYNGLVFDITSGTVQNGAALAGTLGFQQGSLLFGAATELAGNLFGTSNIRGSGGNTSTALASWNGSALVLPFAFQTTGGNGRVENWTGVITAVPEPSSLGLVALVGICFTAVQRRNIARRMKTC